MAVGRTRLEPGAYELLAGASSEDIRLRTTITLTGEPATPRPVRETGLNAADFDEQRDTEIVDRTKVSGDAVSPRADATGELVHRGCDFGTGVTRVEVEASGEGVVEVSLDGALTRDGRLRRDEEPVRLHHHRRRVRGPRCARPASQAARPTAARAGGLLRLRVRTGRPPGPGTGRHRCRAPSGDCLKMVVVSQRVTRNAPRP